MLINLSLFKTLKGEIRGLATPIPYTVYPYTHKPLVTPFPLRLLRLYLSTEALA